MENEEINEPEIDLDDIDLDQNEDNVVEQEEKTTPFDTFDLAEIATEKETAQDAVEVKTSAPQPEQPKKESKTEKKYKSRTSASQSDNSDLERMDAYYAKMYESMLQKNSERAATPELDIKHAEANENLIKQLEARNKQLESMGIREDVEPEQPQQIEQVQPSQAKSESVSRVDNIPAPTDKSSAFEQAVKDDAPPKQQVQDVKTETSKPQSEKEVVQKERVIKLQSTQQVSKQVDPFSTAAPDVVQDRRSEDANQILYSEPSLEQPVSEDNQSDRATDDGAQLIQNQKTYNGEVVTSSPVANSEVAVSSISPKPIEKSVEKSIDTTKLESSIEKLTEVVASISEKQPVNNSANTPSTEISNVQDTAAKSQSNIENNSSQNVNLIGSFDESNTHIIQLLSDINATLKTLKIQQVWWSQWYWI